MLNLGIVGIGGRMGHAMWDCCQGMNGIKIICGIDISVNSLPAGCQAEVKGEPEQLESLPAMFIDFSRPVCSMKVLEFCSRHGISAVVGTTGFDYAQKEQIREYAKNTAIVLASNFSVGINVLLSLIRKAAAVMSDADLEIVEAHHRYKADAPSGTALSMGEAAAAGRNVNLKDVMVCGRNGITGERSYGTIGFASIRGGDIVGEHKAMFCSDGERLELGHVATSRLTFAKGALRAAMWLDGKKPGLYSFEEVLNLNQG